MLWRLPLLDVWPRRLSADEVLARVQRAFDTRQDDNRRSPETDEQHAFVREFVAGLQR